MTQASLLRRRVFGRAFGRARRHSSAPAVILEPVPATFFHLFQTLLLFRREERCDLAVCFGKCVADLPASIAADLFQLRARSLDDRRNLGHLFVGQTKLPS